MDTQYRRGIRRLSVENAIILADRRETADLERRKQQIEHNAFKEEAVRRHHQQRIEEQRRREHRQRSIRRASLFTVNLLVGFGSTTLVANHPSPNLLQTVLAWVLLAVGLRVFWGLTAKIDYPASNNQLRYSERLLWVTLGLLTGISLSLTPLGFYVYEFIFLR